VHFSKGKTTPNGLVRLVKCEIVGHKGRMTEGLPVKPPFRL
jgi:hypothetical protein